MAFVFEGDEKAAIKIFEEWQRIPSLDDYVTITFIEGEIEKLKPNGYTCLITPNMQKTVERVLSLGDEDNLILTLNRFQRVYPKDNFIMYNTFKKIVLANKNSQVSIIPITLKDKTKGSDKDNLNLHFDKMISTKNIKYKDAKDIKKDDLESCVIPKFNKDFPLDED